MNNTISELVARAQSLDIDSLTRILGNTDFNLNALIPEYGLSAVNKILLHNSDIKILTALYEHGFDINNDTSLSGNDILSPLHMIMQKHNSYMNIVSDEIKFLIDKNSDLCLEYNRSGQSLIYMLPSDLMEYAIEHYQKVIQYCEDETNDEKTKYEYNLYLKRNKKAYTEVLMINNSINELVDETK